MNWVLISIAGLVISAVFVFSRLPVLTPDRAFLGLSSDNAIYALMAQDILVDGKIPVFFYGQHYQGPLTAIVIAGVQSAMSAAGFHQIIPGTADPYAICPLAVSVASTLMTLAGILCFSLFVRRIYDGATALVFALILSIGHSMLVEVSLRPLGAEMALLTGGWMALAFERWIRKRDSWSLFMAGVCTGIGLWMNEMTVFVLLPFILWLAIRRAARIKIWRPLKLNDRFLLSGAELELRELPLWTRVAGIFIHTLLAINFAGGLIAVWLGGWETVLFGIRMKVPNGLSPIKVSVFFFVLIQLVWWLASTQSARIAFRRFAEKFWPGFTGFLIAYFPVVFGGMLGWYGPGYGVKFRIMAVRNIPGHAWDAAVNFLPGFLSGSTNPPAIIGFWICILILLVCLAARSKKFRWSEWPNHIHSLRMIPWLMAFGNLLYMLLDDRVSQGLVPRYALFTFIGLWMILSDAGMKLWRRPASSPVTGNLVRAGVVAALLLFGAAYYRDGKKLIREISIQPDPRPKVQELISSQYRVGYADFWFAYKYEFLTGRKVLFIPYRSQDRTPERSRRLAEMPGKKCLIVKNDGDQIVEYTGK